MRNERTPRTMAETHFCTGYRSSQQSSTHTAEWVILALFVGWVLAMIFGG